MVSRVQQVMRSAVSHNSGGRQTVGTDSVEGSGQAKGNVRERIWRQDVKYSHYDQASPKFWAQGLPAFLPGGISNLQDCS